MHRLRTVTSLDVSAVAGHHAMPAALLFNSISVISGRLGGGGGVVKGVVQWKLVYCWKVFWPPSRAGTTRSVGQSLPYRANRAPGLIRVFAVTKR